MTEPDAPVPNNDPNELIARILTFGVTVSFVLLLAGLVWTVALPLTGRAAPGPTIRNPATGAIHGNVALLAAGLLVLMATPVLRVLAAIWSFARKGDRRYTRISGFVLLMVAASAVLSLLHVAGGK